MILKLAGHPTIDLLFRRAFPEMMILDLDAGEIHPNREDWRYKASEVQLFPIRSYIEDKLLSACAIGWCLKERLGIYRPDLFIVEDFFTLMVAREVLAQRLIWYCHADYTANNPHNPFVRHALNLGDTPSIYPTEDKKTKNSGWREEHSSAVIPLGLPDESFVQPGKKNGRKCIVRQEIKKRLELYDPKFISLYQEIAKAPKLDIYGDGSKKGWISPISRLKNYSVALEPFGNRSVSVAQLELMAAGIPLITYPREGFEEPSPNYELAATAEGFCRDVDPEMGLRGQQFVRENYNQELWIKRVREFIDG